MDIFGLIVYLIILGAAWLFRLAYLGWFGIFLFWFVVIVPPAVCLLSLPSVLSLRLSIKAPESVSCGEKAMLRLRFTCPRFLPAGKIRMTLNTVNLYTGKEENTNYSFDSAGNSVSELPIETSFCGALQIRIKNWTCADLLGILSLKKRDISPVLCTVLPVPRKPDSAVTAETAPEAQPRMKPKYGGGYAEDHELRAYRPGDMMNSVHWKISSKMDDLIVREALVPENDKIYIIMQSDGNDGRGLQSLYWLSQQLNQHELAHMIVSNDLYTVSDDASTIAALKGILGTREKGPIYYTLSDARTVYTVRGEEVEVS